MVKQATLHAFIRVKAMPSNECLSDDSTATGHSTETIQQAEVACQASESCCSNLTIRSLISQSCGYQSGRRTRSDLQHLGWRKTQQVAAYAPHSGTFADDPISSISISSKNGRIAFAQASGVVSIYSLARLYEDAEHSRNRLQEKATQHETAETGAERYHYSAALQTASHDDIQPQNHTGAATRNASSQCSTHQYLEQLSRRHMHKLRQQQKQLEACTIEPLPTHYDRWVIDQGHRVEEVCWSPTQHDMLAVAGDGTNINLIRLGEGRYTKTVLTRPPNHSGITAGNVRLSRLAMMAQGPYTLAATGQSAPGAFLWDTRRSKQATSLLIPAGRVPLTSCLQASQDGHLLFCVTQDNKLMIWDLRKGSNTSGVMHFGGTGLYHHPVVTCQDIGGAVTAAIHTALEPITSSKQQQDTAMDTQLKRSCPPVDQILLDPQHSMRITMILQDCSAAVYHLPSNSITHLCMSPSQYVEAGLPQTDRSYTMRRKRGCWSSGGDHLVMPHMVVTALQGSQEPLSVTHQETLYDVSPAVGILDCRTGSYSNEQWTQADSIAKDFDTVRQWRAFTGFPVAGMPHSMHQVAALPTEADVTACRAMAEATALHALYRPSHVVPVLDWVTSLASDNLNDLRMFAGTQKGCLLLLRDPS